MLFWYYPTAVFFLWTNVDETDPHLSFSQQILALWKTQKGLLYLVIYSRYSKQDKPDVLKAPFDKKTDQRHEIKSGQSVGIKYQRFQFLIKK